MAHVMPRIQLGSKAQCSGKTSLIRAAMRKRTRRITPMMEMVAVDGRLSEDAERDVVLLDGLVGDPDHHRATTSVPLLREPNP
jgi:hypothetical protein